MKVWTDGSDLLVTQSDLTAPPVYSPTAALLHKKKSTPLKKDMCDLSQTVFQLHTIVAIEE